MYCIEPQTDENWWKTTKNKNWEPAWVKFMEAAVPMEEESIQWEGFMKQV